jgi:hypothetical protein
MIFLSRIFSYVAWCNMAKMNSPYSHEIGEYDNMEKLHTKAKSTEIAWAIRWRRDAEGESINS